MMGRMRAGVLIMSVLLMGAFAAPARADSAAAVVPGVPRLLPVGPCSDPWGCLSSDELRPVMTTGSLAAQPGEIELSATARDLKLGINTVMIEPDLQRWDGQGWTTVAGLAPLDYRADRPPARWWVPVDQGRYRWTSTAFDPLDVTQRSAPAAWHYFTVDRTGPMSGPVVRPLPTTPGETLYTSDTVPSGGVGMTAPFVFFTPVSPDGTRADVVGYQWRLNDVAMGEVKSGAGLRARAFVDVTPPKDGVNEIRVVGLDRAGNVSNSTVFRFMVASPLAQAHQWSFTAPSWLEDLNTGPSSSRPLTTYGATTDRDVAVLGGSGQHLATSGAAVDTLHSTTISVWVRPDASAGGVDRILLSQEGASAPGLQVFLRGSDRRVCARVAESDVAGAPERVIVCSAGAITLGAWTHVGVVLDVSANALVPGWAPSLMVTTSAFDADTIDAVKVPIPPGPGPWRAPGDLKVGASQTATPAMASWWGQLDHLFVLPEAVDADYIGLYFAVEGVVSAP